MSGISSRCTTYEVRFTTCDLSFFWKSHIARRRRWCAGDDIQRHRFAARMGVVSWHATPAPRGLSGARLPSHTALPSVACAGLRGLCPFGTRPVGKINIFAIECAAVAAHRAAGLGRGYAGERRPTGPRQGLKPGRYAMTGGIRRGAGMARQEVVDGSPRKGRGGPRAGIAMMLAVSLPADLRPAMVFSGRHVPTEPGRPKGLPLQ